MLSMTKRHDTHLLFASGHDQLEVARLVGASRRTVQRVLQEGAVEQVDNVAARAARRIGRPSKVQAFREWLRVAVQGGGPRSRRERAARACHSAGLVDPGWDGQTDPARGGQLDPSESGESDPRRGGQSDPR